MKPLIVLIAVFAIVSTGSEILLKNWNLPFAGNLAMCIMLIFAASGHFLFTEGMTLMLPPAVPFRTFIIYLTGVTEIIGGLALMFPLGQHLAGCVLILFFLILLPANIYAAIKHVDIEHATYSGPGPHYLWFRIPLQILFVGWLAYFSTSLFL
jgi:uncharacterized membrane protein